MNDQVTLAEAADILSVPIGTLNSWRGRKQIHPTGRARNPATNRLVRVYSLEELIAVQRGVTPGGTDHQPTEENQ